MEFLQQVHNFSQRHFMGHGRGTVAALGAKNRRQAVIITAVVAHFQRVQHFLHQIIDVQQFQLCGAVVHRDGQIVGSVVTKCRYRAVIIRAAPFAEQVREAVDQHRRTGLLGVSKEQFLARQFAFAVIALAVAADERCLDAAGQHDWAGVAVAFQHVQQGRGKAKVALHELSLVFGPVDARQVKDKIRLGAVFLQQDRVGIYVVFVDLVHGQGGAGTVFAVPQVFQVLAQVAPYKAFGAGDKNFHALLSSFSISWMYSVVLILAMVSSTFRRRVLWLV